METYIEKILREYIGNKEKLVLRTLLLWLRYRNILHGHRKWSRELASLWDQARTGYVFVKETRIFSHLLGESGCTLEVACGTCRYSELFEPEEYVGLDFSKAMLQVAKKKHPQLQFVLADAFNFPFREGCFETVFTSRFVHHYSDLNPFFSEVSRVSRRLVFDTTCGNFIIKLAILLFKNKIHYRTGFEAIEKIDGSGLKVRAFVNFFVLPATVYSLIPDFLAELVDRVFAFMPSRSFILAEKRRAS